MYYNTSKNKLRNFNIFSMITNWESSTIFSEYINTVTEAIYSHNGKKGTLPVK